jgi:phage repressor protein C with HTH and peptisase S24 domain
MARRKTLPESVRAKLMLAERLAALRSELFGDRGGPEMARRLGIPVRTWYNYEGGVTVPAEVILKIIELTAVEPAWLLHGEGPKFRTTQPDRRDTGRSPAMTIGALLRTALKMLESDESMHGRKSGANPDDQLESISTSGEEEAVGPFRDPETAANHHAGSEPSSEETGSRLSQARREWLSAQKENRCIQINGDAMAPIVADGASVAYARNEEDVRLLDGKMVVTWLENQPVVRWFQHCGRFALLRAENPNASPQQVLVDLEDPGQRPNFRRVLWITTPH